jgi:mannosyl-3-phosphoglycerate phosphatase
VRGFSSLSAPELAQLTGLETSAAERALRREYDEPFLLDAGSDEALTRAAAARGLKVTRGGRFHHLLGPVDKGRALDRLLALYAAEGRRFALVALGDSPNDLSMLQRADRPILVPRAAGPDAKLAAGLPRAEVAGAPGPAGWNEAVLTVLRGGFLARVG